MSLWCEPTLKEDEAIYGMWGYYRGGFNSYLVSNSSIVDYILYHVPPIGRESSIGTIKTIIFVLVVQAHRN